MRCSVLFTIAVAIALSACATAPKMFWMRTDGQSTVTDPVLSQQYQIDRTVCLGEREKADLSGVTVSQGGLVGAVAAVQRSNAADAVAQGCMAQKGYIIVREDEVDAKRQELAALAAEKARREAAAAAPPPSASKTATVKPKPQPSQAYASPPPPQQ
jgi:hypothetical protein